ncbi:hypothetical protein K450DRAFT_254484 [Umbelopsis ramanniana AG]|uniref:Uncharacterized protein n=1 Tax=Umbelopsis ramanniana AG TaxID=1314678 RepID=A0AAD5E3P9_UMBRA|nr:uncharacterized protein K450DRAFT_254484 [Umbelopsis ramanniana AG]KAI8576973.1 hypothetical protein K450DRAFT_254484 [Umbelopsis ramanniana AG]
MKNKHNPQVFITICGRQMNNLARSFAYHSLGVKCFFLLFIIYKPVMKRKEFKENRHMEIFGTFIPHIKFKLLLNIVVVCDSVG